MTQNAAAVTKHQLVEEFNSVVAETEQLLRSVAKAGGENAGALHATVEQSLANAKDRLRNLQATSTEQARAAARATDKYVRENPWQIVGVAAGLGMLIGMMLGRR
jgi:ElaB/YqjD/DUF883 family membrane-anchored ribosome-binding protein